MRAPLLVVVVALTLCGIAATAQPPGDAGSETGATVSHASERVTVPEPTPQALSYYRSGNVLWVVDNLWGLAVPALFLFTGLLARIRDWADAIGRKWFFTVTLYFAIFTAFVFVIDLPLSYYEGFVREHAYGLSNQTFGKWAQDQVRKP